MMDIMYGQLFFFSGMNPMISSRNCTIQQSSVNVGISVYMETITAKYVGMHELRMYDGNIISQQCLAEHCKLSALKKSEAELRSN